MSQTTTADDFAPAPPGESGKLLSPFLFGFEIVSVASLLGTGVWFVVAGWGAFTNIAAITAFVAVGLAGALVVLPLAISARHWAAAGAAAVAVVTPTGFAYLPNLLMIAVVVIEVRTAITVRTHRL